MASVTETQQTNWPKNTDSGNSLTTEGSTTRTNLRARFAAGNTITADDLNQLRGLMNAFQRHYHRYTDYSYQHTYGNNGPGTSSSDNDSGLARGYTDPGTTSAGSTITASYINGHVNAANALRSHDHYIYDNY